MLITTQSVVTFKLLMLTFCSEKYTGNIKPELVPKTSRAVAVPTGGLPAYKQYYLTLYSVKILL